MKKCSRCKIEKEDSLFAKNSKYCKSCAKEYKKLYYLNNLDLISKKRKIYYLNNKDEIKSNSKLWRDGNKDKKKLSNNIYVLSHLDEITKYQENYRLNNKDNAIIYQREYKKERKKIDPSFKLRGDISTTINIALIAAGSLKDNKSILKYLPYTIQELKNYLESLFEPWMNWNNRGIYRINEWIDSDQSTWVWNIDHIIPQSKLPYTSMEDDNFKKCWALSNLRPYSAKQNIIDGNRRS